MPIAPRMNQPVGPYDFWRDTLQPGLLGLYDRWTEQKPWPTPEQINAAVQNPGLLDREAIAGYAVDMAQPFAAKLGGLLGHMPVPEGGLFGITTWHGSPHKWTKPDISKVGTGEGAQAYGHGFYSAEAEEVAKAYKTAGQGGGLRIDGKSISGIYRDDVADMSADEIRALSLLRDESSLSDAMVNLNLGNYGDSAEAVRRLINSGRITERPQGNIYKLDIPDEDVARYLDWDKPLSEQAPDVQAAIQTSVGQYVPVNKGGEYGVTRITPEGYGVIVDGLSAPTASDALQKMTGERAYWDAINYRIEDAAKASELLKQAGIPGIRYLDGSSRRAGEGTYNYVTFDPSRITVLERNGEDLRGLLGISDNANALLMDEAGRASRMKEMGHERGFWRGGKKAADGPWYARSKEGAAGFDRGDLREYSLKMDNAFSYGKTYTPEDLKEIKSALETRGYDQTAKYLLDIPGDYGGAAPGEAIVQAVKMATGPQAMGPIFKEAGFDVIDMGTELIVTHGQGTVRDAVRAAYDKAKQASPDIFAGLLAPAVGLGAYGFLGPNDDSL